MAVWKKGAFVALVAALVVLMTAAVAFASPDGAIFTTKKDGGVVNGNIYTAKGDVYLNGGPGINAPVGAASLPDGLYYFQVTDPPGKNLLSTDPINKRQFEVVGGKITWVYNHLTGTDTANDHGGLTVQLMPYLDTPNNGGEYKVWAIPQDKYGGDQFFGFDPSWSKTDNFKVKKGNPPCIKIYKFKDIDWDGKKDANEPYIHWFVKIKEPGSNVANWRVTPVCYQATVPGCYQITELDLSAWGWYQTAAFVDGFDMWNKYFSPTVLVDVKGNEKECHTVEFGNMRCEYNTDPCCWCAD